MMPKRIQRRRTKGWRMPTHTKYVGRPSHYSNPFLVEKYGAEKAVELFRLFLTGELGVEKVVDKAIRRYERQTGGATMDVSARVWLHGWNLACWCKEGEPCHADALLEISNAAETAIAPPVSISAAMETERGESIKCTAHIM